MARPYRYLLAILDKTNHATDQFEVINFNYGNNFHPSPKGVTNSNFAGLKLIMEAVRDERLMLIKKMTDDITVRFLNAHHNKKMFRALQFMIFAYHYRTKGLWSEKVVDDQWYLRELYTMTDVRVNNMAPRLQEQPGPVDNILLDITGDMTAMTWPGQGKPMGAKIYNLPKVASAAA
jgi:hypothetical protein